MKIKKIFPAITLLVLVTVLLPMTTHGADLKSVLTTFKDRLIALGAILATISFIVAGIMFLLATTDPSKMNTAKMALIAAIAGVALIALAPLADGFVKNLFGL